MLQPSTAIIMLTMSLVATQIGAQESTKLKRSAGSIDANATKVAAVESRRLTEARADWWGFDPLDATESLQAAIDSGVKKLIVPKMSTPWVVRPIKLASDQEIVFDAGVVIEAKRDELHGVDDALFSASDQHGITLRGTDAVLRMHKTDYQDCDLYQRSEWRHVIALRSCSRVKIEGLTLRSSGGDGIYIGANREPKNHCEDITVKDSDQCKRKTCLPLALSKDW